MKRSVSAETNLKASSVHVECDLRGMMTDEGVAVLDKYLDDATLAGLPEVRIIHGKGTGAMRKAVHQYLKHSRYVRSYRLGNMGEGDSGVTVAQLKDRSNS
jgi:DNA mismatch repair protein MutS2